MVAEYLDGIAVNKYFKINAFTIARPGFTGIWAGDENNIKTVSKIAAIGLKLKHWVSYHGISVNINPNMLHYAGIVPCGLVNSKVTSMAEMGSSIAISNFDMIFLDVFSTIFNVELSTIFNVELMQS